MAGREVRFAVVVIGLLALEPLLAAESLPSQIPDLSQSASTAHRKQRFVEFLAPQIRIANDEIWAERSRLLSLTAQFSADGQLGSNEVNELFTLGERYEVPRPMRVDTHYFNALKKRVDTVPAGLVLAQAANESGWGASHFARDGNNLFGVWCYSPGCGIKPRKRNARDTHEVRRFESVLEGIRHYLHMLNTKLAFAELHDIRAGLRERNELPTALSLADGLRMYSQRRGAYVREIKAIVRENAFHRHTINRNLK